MAGPLTSTDAFVLLRRPAKESFETLTLFSADLGTLQVFHRIPRKNGTGHVPVDLFDEGAFLLETGRQGTSAFVREVRILRRFPGIGRSYTALTEACALGRWIASNPVAEESRTQVRTLLVQALDAYGRTDRPDVVSFKALYCFARDEGHPVRQHWAAALSAADLARVDGLLRLPADAHPEPAAEVARLRTRLEEYLRGHAEMDV
jgi:hypothetical protein